VALRKKDLMPTPDLLTDATCPDCRGEHFVIGPRGGLAANVRCAGCGSKFWYCPPFPSERIDNADSFYTQPPIRLRDWQVSD